MCLRCVAAWRVPEVVHCSPMMPERPTRGEPYLATVLSSHSLSMSDRADDRICPAKQVQSKGTLLSPPSLPLDPTINR